MRQGSVIHKTLEDQVHQTVSVDITSREDAWGLRIWNVIQGLNTLRETGMTRELEVWGTIDGLVVNGVIDELSFVCPNEALEEAEAKPDSKDIVPVNQTTISDFFRGPSSEDGQNAQQNARSLQTARKIYVTDVKTRGAKSVPKGPSFRPTEMQLMFYHRLLSDLVMNKVDADILFERYRLNPDVPFSDSFIAQIGSLNNISDDMPPPLEADATQPTQDGVSLLLAHNSLRSLWKLMISELARTLPAGKESIGSVLKAEYRNATDGKIIGAKTFLYDDMKIQAYLEDGLKWWKGERSAQGVCIEEAYKCGSCEFADDCDWRKNKVVEATEKMRRSRSVV